MDYVRADHKFVLFIMSHNKPYDCVTYDTLMERGYSGDWYIVIDDKDKSIEEYKKRFGEDRVLIFNKQEVAKKFDLMDNFDNDKCVIFARNVCFDLAEQLGYEYFCELDDDYVDFFARWKEGDTLKRKTFKGSLEDVFNAYLEFLDCSDVIQCVSLPQGGDMIGGLGSNLSKKGYLRKCMNSQICKVSDRFYFHGRLNEDVNAYLDCSDNGRLFLQVLDVESGGILLDQRPTQTGGGMTGIYDMGTYLKSFYSVMRKPSAVQINMMGDTHLRIHHHINDQYAHPKIISSCYKKEY